jgi:small-conductance mechanosensitive channel
LFSIFPATKGIAVKLINYVLDPFKSIVRSFIDYIPELITIIVISFIFHNVVRFLKFLSHEIESEKLVIPGFYPDWARSTFNILRIIIYAFAFIVIFPYLPGSDSPVFQGVSVFLGLLLSLGSSSAIGNIIAGLVITYMRAFRIGDRVKIGDTTGDVIEKSMLVTRLRTIKNEEITIPNSAILNGSTTNYSSSAQHLGLILNTVVTIGYDVPWRKIEKLLIEAAQKTNLIELNPKPFVLQTSLDDFYVSYQLNAYTKHPGSAAKIYSELHAHIQDLFAEANVEIMSPHYQANREGPSTIPAKSEPPKKD